MKAEIGTDILVAKTFLENGNAIAIPTETVYGLAANALNELAVAKIFQIKNRPFFNPLIIHLSDIEAIGRYVKKIPEEAIRLFEEFSPGALTILLEKSDLLPDIVTAGSTKVAVRIPDHPLILKLLQTLDYPLAAPSANPFGYVSPTTSQHVVDQLGSQIPYILEGGPCKVGLESTIVGFENGQGVIYRLGGVAVEEIKRVVGSELVFKTSVEHIPIAPGMLKSHYSPHKAFYVGEIKVLLKDFTNRRVGVISFTEPFFQAEVNYILSKTGDLAEAASNLFSAIRKLDESDIEVIIAEWLPERGLGRDINDRLNRARLKFD